VGLRFLEGFVVPRHRRISGFDGASRGDVLAGETERNIKGPEYEGRLYTEQRYELIGTMGGQRFDANLETSRGHDNASFLVNEQTKGVRAAISLN